METTIDGTHLLAIGWLKKLARNKTPLAYTYVATTGTTTPGTPCKVARQDTFGNSSFIAIPRPLVLETYELYAGATDLHNRLR